MKKLYIVAGPAASGKSKFSNLLSRQLGCAVLDFDDDIEELINHNQNLISKIGMEKFLETKRDKRYQNLINRSKAQLEKSDTLVICAPFSSEVKDPNLWEQTFRDFTGAGVTLSLFWISTSPEVRRERALGRGAERDIEKLAAAGREPFLNIEPKVPHTLIDGEADFAELVAGIKK